MYPGWTKTGTRPADPFQATRYTELLGDTVPYYWTLAFTGVLGRSYYAKAYFEYMSESSPPAFGGGMTLMRFRASATSLVSVRITSDGKLQLWNDVGSTQIGSDATAWWNSVGFYSIGHTVEVRVNIGTGSVDSAELKIDGVTVASGSSLSISDAALTHWDVGLIAAATEPYNWSWHDLGLNDDQGSSDNSWLGFSQIIALTGDWANSEVGGWKGGGGGDAHNNSGVRSFAGLNSSPTDATQVRNAVSQASNYMGGDADTYSNFFQAFVGYNTYLDDYTILYLDGTRGLLKSFQQFCYGHAEEASGTTAGSLQLTSNPALTALTFNFGNDAGAFSAAYAGNTTGNWYNSKDAITYSFGTITYSGAAHWRLTKTTATTAAVAVCGAFVLAEWYPVADFGISTVSEMDVEGATDTVPVDTSVMIGSETITLSASDLPTDVTADFDPETVSPGGSSTLTFTVAETVAEDTSATVKVTGTAASATHDSLIKIKIKKKPDPKFVYMLGFA
jgi:hypothetical protein